MANSRNVMSNMKAYADLKRNAFDLQNGHYYSQKVGEIIPIKAIHTIPGDYMDISINDRNLSFPMNTAAFVHARKEITSYFVPYNHVYSLFNQLQATRPDPKTSALVKVDETKEPRVALVALYFNVLSQWYYYFCYTVFVPLWAKKMKYTYPNANHSLQQFTEVAQNMMLNLPVSGATVLESIDVSFAGDDQIYTLEFPTFTPWNTTIGGVAGAGFSTFTDFEHGVPQQGYVSTFKDYAFDIEDRFRAFSWMRKLDMLGYCNLYPLFKSVENQIVADYSEEDSYDLDAFNTYFSLLYENILQMSCSSIDKTDPTSWTIVPYYVNIYSILAYNKVFYDYFRNTYYDLNYNSRNYNIDFAATSNFDPLSTGIIPLNDLDIRFLDIEYHQWKKDIVTGLLPEAQYGAVAGLSMSVDLNSLTGSVSGETGTDAGKWQTTNGGNIGAQNYVVGTGSRQLGLGTSSQAGYIIEHTHSLAGSVSVNGGTREISFDVLSLKRAEMLQDYRQMLMRNGNRTIDIFKGLYGDAPASEDDNSPRFLDAFGSTVFVDTIVSTADTSEQNSTKGALGDLGARSTISGSGHFNFKTSDFGCVLILGYIVPDAVYPSYGLSAANRALDPESHFIPFFQNLGFQPLYNFDRNLYFGGIVPDPQDKQIVRGFAPSYVHLKTDVDYAHGNFTNLPAANLTNNINLLTGDYSVVKSDFVGSFNHWVPVRHDVVLNTTSLMKYLYISPSYFDNIFIQQATADFESDHFIVDTHIFVKAVRKLSKLGLPNF